MVFDRLQALQVEHHGLTKLAFGYDHIRPKHHVRFHLPKQLLRAGFHVDCFPGEKKHKLYKSHVGLHRFDPWTQHEDGSFSHFVLRQMWQHHIEAVKNYDFDDGLLGNATDDLQLAQVLGTAQCQISTALQVKGRSICAGDVLLGEHPGLVVSCIRANGAFYIKINILEPIAEYEFYSLWTITTKPKIISMHKIGKKPSWWLPESDVKLRCVH